MLTFDLETVALPDADHFLEPVEAPSNYKDEAKIAAYKTGKRLELLDRSALDPDLCEIIAIGWLDEGAVDPTVVTAQDYATQPEATMLQAFWKALAKSYACLGYNILDFDLPVLVRRSQYLNVEIPELAFNLDRYRTPHVDLMQRLSFNGKLKYRSLDFYCSRFNIEIEDPCTGADIGALVAAGQWGVVEAHCKAGVLKAAALAARVGLLVAEPVL